MLLKSKNHNYTKINQYMHILPKFIHAKFKNDHTLNVYKKTKNNPPKMSKFVFLVLTDHGVYMYVVYI